MTNIKEKPATEYSLGGHKLVIGGRFKGLGRVGGPVSPRGTLFKFETEIVEALS